MPKLTKEAALRVAKKIGTMMDEEKAKPSDKQRSKEQVVAIAYQMENEGKL
jgi:hypothetical protein